LNRDRQVPVREIVSHIYKTDDVLPRAVQAELLGISRSSLYYEPQPVNPKTLVVMNRIDEIYTAHPFFGSRRMAREIGVNRKQIQRLMREMRLEALYPKPNLSKNANQHPTYPYLLRGITANHPNHIWGTDITYVRMHQGFVYLVAFLDWYSRYVLSWRISTMLTTDFVLEAAHEALSVGTPEITNSDQGVQFTSQDYLSVWNPDTTRISMDGRGRAMDNIFTERLWRSVKYEEIYLKEYTSVVEAKDNIGKYFHFYNYERKHQSHQYKIPAEIYFERRENLV
jgi:putative transposase